MDCVTSPRKHQLPITTLLTLQGPSSSSNLSLGLMHAFYHSFIPDTIRTWNNLPDYIVCAPSLNSFSNFLKFFFNQLIFAMSFVDCFCIFQYLFFTQLRVNCNCYSSVHLTISLLLFMYPLLCINFHRTKKKHKLSLVSTKLSLHHNCYVCSNIHTFASSNWI